MRCKFVYALAATGLMALSLAPAHAQEQKWPTKPVRLVSPAPSGSDVLWRLLQPKLQEIWGQPVVIDNRPGASGNIAIQEVLRAKDNETIYGGPDSVATVNAHFFKQLPFLPDRDLTAVSYVSRYNQLLVCSTKTGFGNIADFMGASRKAPVTVAVSGGFGATALATALLSKGGRLNLTMVNYKGPSQSILDIAAGEVQCGVMSSRVALPFVREGKVRALAITGTNRSPLFPSVPTIAEAAVPGYDASFYEVVLASSRMPKEIVTKINRDIAKVLESPEIQRKMAELDFVPVGDTLTDASKRMHEDSRKWSVVSKSLTITPE